jgi:FkbH-like protein
MTPNTEQRQTIRESFLSRLKSGDIHHAIRAARSMLEDECTVSQWMFIRNAVERAQSKGGLKPLKVGLLSSFSSEFLHAPLIAYGFLNGLDIQLYQAGFGQFRQEILDPRSGLYEFAPDVTILAVEGRDWTPAVYRQYLTGLETGFEGEIQRVREELQTLTETFRRRCSTTLLINNFAAPVWPQLGILDLHVPDGQAEVINTLNEMLRTLAREGSGFYVVPYAALVARVGALQWYDERMNQFAGAPIAAPILPHLVKEYMKFFRGLTGQSKKCLVVDLDDTLWGGIVGEVGADGIQLGPVYPGSAFVAFQDAILDLQRRGVLLAIASKNNPADVDEVFERHAHMILKKEHFSCIQVGWQAKSESLMNIAQQLNIGLEHVVFVDDNPVECEEVASALPMVRAIHLSKQPENYVRELVEEGLFDGLSFSAEDLKRGALYQQRDQAETLRAQSRTLEEFYQSLEMKLVFAPAHRGTLARAAQLTQKTNQITVTTIRYTESDVKERMADADWLVTTVSALDRFGDNGIVGVIMARFDSGILDVDTLLLSCRVAGRTVETAMLAYLCEQADRRGVEQIRGRIVPTPKNIPARDIFEKHRFRKLSEEKSGETIWELDVSQERIHYPEWMEVSVEVPPVRQTVSEPSHSPI